MLTSLIVSLMDLSYSFNNLNLAMCVLFVSIFV